MGIPVPANKSFYIEMGPQHLGPGREELIMQNIIKAVNHPIFQAVLLAWHAVYRWAEPGAVWGEI